MREREGGRLAGWRGGGAPSRRRRRSVAFPQEDSRWAGAWGPASPSPSLSQWVHLQAQAKGRPTIPAPAQSPNSRCEGDRCVDRAPRGVESGIACRLASPNLQATTAADDHTQLPGSP